MSRERLTFARVLVERVEVLFLDILDFELLDEVELSLIDHVFGFLGLAALFGQLFLGQLF